MVLKPVHPEEILREEFMEPLALNANKLALALRVSAPGVYEIIREERDISPEMALRLGRCLGTSREFWLNSADSVRPGSRSRHKAAQSRAGSAAYWEVSSERGN